MDYLIENWVEFAAVILSIVYLYFSVREKSALWIFGFISSALYAWVFFHSKLYAEVSIQIYYLAVSVYGWIHWQLLDSTTKKNSSEKLKISTIGSSKDKFVYFFATVVIYFLYLIILKFFTDSPIPYLDSVIGALSIIATWMLAKKKIENWLVFIAVDFFAIFLYIYKELYPTAILFLIYTIMAIVGYNEWNRKLKKQENDF